MITPVLVELCAGSAAVSLRWLDSRAKPPIGYQGGKRGYANAILRALGLQPGGGRRDGRVILVEPGPWGEAWALWRTLDGRRDTIERLRAWAGEDPRALWERLRGEAVPAGREERVATWAVLSLWSFAQKPVTAAGSWIEHGFNAADTYPDAYSGRTVGNFGNREAPRVPALADKIAALPDLSRVQVHHGCATDLPPLPDAIAYLDPPYQGTTGYGFDLPRADVLALAERWRLHGATVCVSEAETLPLDGWHATRLPKPHGVVRSWSAQKDEWLTLSRPPCGQLDLLGGAA